MALPIRPFCVVTLAGVLGLVAACGSHRAATGWNGGRPSTYSGPGPAGDPWGPYIREASGRFHVPERWVRAVMHQESGGHQYLNGRPTTSWAGATGLMQVMPGTYAELAARYGLGPDPYDPHDNIMAGTAYIHELYQKYGSPGFLAAYNAGPGRMDSYVARGGSLPSETVNYVASISPNLGGGGAEAVTEVATAAAVAPPPASAPAPRAYAAAQPDLTPIPPSYVAPVPDETPEDAAAAGAAAGAVAAAPVAQAPVPQPPPRAAYAASALGAGSVAGQQRPYQTAAMSPAMSPGAPAYVAPHVPLAARAPEYRLVAGRPYAAMASGGAVAARAGSGVWAIQVGAFNSPALARLATEGARQGGYLIGGEATVTPVSHGGATLYRARLTGLSEGAAREACGHLRTIGSACDVIKPERGA